MSIDTSAITPVPQTQRLCKYWWDGEKEPWYGDVCALKAGDYIYAYGHVKDNPWVYLARVKTQSAFNLNSYEYWNGECWQHEKLYREHINEKQSIFWQINQGQVIWSCYHQCFLFIYCDNFWSCQILVSTHCILFVQRSLSRLIRSKQPWPLKARGQSRSRPTNRNQPNRTGMYTLLSLIHITIHQESRWSSHTQITQTLFKPSRS